MYRSKEADNKIHDIILKIDLKANAMDRKCALTSKKDIFMKSCETIRN